MKLRVEEILKEKGKSKYWLYIRLGLSYQNFNKIVNNLVRIVAVAEHILTAEKHLQLGVRAFFADKAQSFPWVLVKKTKAGIECCAAPALKRAEADLVKLVENINKFVRPHSCCDERLMRVTQNGFGNSNFRHNFTSVKVLSIKC